MRQFTVVERIQEAEFNLIEKEFNINLTELFRDYLKKYGGMAILENTFISNASEEFQVGQFLMFDEIFKLSKEFLQEYKRKLIPFAYDPGGWHFCVCFDTGEDNGKIIVNRWTDHVPEEQFLVIANGFEEFINGLKREDEIS